MINNKIYWHDKPLLDKIVKHVQLAYRYSLSDELSRKVTLLRFGEIVHPGWWDLYSIAL